MAKFAVVKTGGKQYLVKENDEIIVSKLENNENDKLDLETLAVFDDSGAVELGNPLKKSVSVQVVSNFKGDKIRVARFKSKVRRRKVNGFRAQLTKLKVLAI